MPKVSGEKRDNCAYCIKCGTPLDIDQIKQNYKMEELKKRYDTLKNAVTLLESRLEKDTQEKIAKIVPQ